MSTYHANVKWARKKSEAYIDNQYSRSHTWTFESGLVIPASASVHIVQPPYSVAENIDPEEAFVASLSSCHMLFFLSIAAKNNFIVDEYRDKAIGTLDKNAAGHFYMSEVTLHPEVIFTGDKQPTLENIKNIHHQSHNQCFIANSVITKVEIII